MWPLQLREDITVRARDRHHSWSPLKGSHQVTGLSRPHLPIAWVTARLTKALPIQGLFVCVGARILLWGILKEIWWKCTPFQQLYFLFNEADHVNSDRHTTWPSHYVASEALTDLYCSVVYIWVWAQLQFIIHFKFFYSLYFSSLF